MYRFKDGESITDGYSLEFEPCDVTSLGLAADDPIIDVLAEERDDIRVTCEENRGSCSGKVAIEIGATFTVRATFSCSDNVDDSECLIRCLDPREAGRVIALMSTE